MNTTEITEQIESNQDKFDLNIDRRDIKSKWGLPKVSDVTNARKALGQPDWQNSRMSEADATELNQYFSLVLDKKLSPDDAILQIASSRNGRAAYCNEIDPDAIAKPSDAKRDETEDKGAAIQAIQEATQQGNIGLAEAGSQMALTNMQSLKVGYAQTLVAEMSDFGNALRSNLTVLAEASAATPLDLRAASLPTAQLSQPVESRRLEPHKATQNQLSKGLW
ncbi:hypothetical protein [Kamptonema sp. UHCC 0994]|uniref:hypothetical protein n=1 Tax=Kamptonema sp. UHCC 0994 TaxID=3031329 RepID=UPI0023B91594|nr:hypothetical protein [Kamptonema sp. UHCC 0994]MDF0552201.1 hypothetical protein [Kamptonema sp. UHCC 0994]